MGNGRDNQLKCGGGWSFFVIPRLDELQIKTVGACELASPAFDLLRGGMGDVAEKTVGNAGENVVGDVGDVGGVGGGGDRILVDNRVSSVREWAGRLEELPSFEQAGARARIHFEPSQTRVGIVTCGGLCPGLNDVIRGLVMTLHYRYGVQTIHGFRYGFAGLIESNGHPLYDLTPESVSHIHELGGTILSSSRGGQSSEAMVDRLEAMGVNILFVIGGDGSMRGAMAICQEVEKRGRGIAVIGVPKTIDNDIPFVEQSFGFDTAFSHAVEAIRGAHVEAKGAPGGIGLVKLMGRNAGFIACHAALANPDVNFVLIPEIALRLDGPEGFLSVLTERIRARQHAVIVVAEGAGQDLFDMTDPTPTDRSGNVRHHDIGLFLRDRIKAHFAGINLEVNMKYIDPSYLIRSCPASEADSVYCQRLAQHAVHAAMAGRTEMVVSKWHGRFVHMPMSLCTRGNKRVDPHDDLWLSVLEATGQPCGWGVGKI